MADEEKSEIQAGAASPVESSSADLSNKIVNILSGVNILATIGIFSILLISFQKEKNKTSIENISTESEHAKEGHEDSKESGEKKENSKEAHDAGHEAKESEHKSSSEGSKMVDLSQFTVNLSTSGSGNPKFVRVSISLEVPNEDVESELKNKLPQVQNTIIDLFNSKKINELSHVEGREYLKDEIKNGINRFLMTGKVSGVYFTNFALAG